MDNENLFETPNENEEPVTDTAAAPEITDAQSTPFFEDAAEVIEEVAEETDEQPSFDDEEAYAEDGYEEHQEEAPVEAKKLSKGTLGAIIALVCVVVVLAALLLSSLFVNKYNHLGFLDTSGTTIGEVCEQSGYDFKQFLTDYSLPSDLPKSTTMNSTFNVLPVKTYAAMYNTDFATLKEHFMIPDTIEKEPITLWEKIKAIFVKEQVEVTEDTPWGFILNNITLGNVYSDSFQEAKEHYGFDDTVTPETLYGEVRRIVETKDMQERIEAEKAAEEAKNSAEDSENAEGGADEDTAAEGSDNAGADTEQEPAEDNSANTAE